MNRSSSNFYNVGLIDDLHTYFPDLLYNSERFHTIQDVLGYIQTNTRERFNIYDRGRREWISQQQNNQNVLNNVIRVEEPRSPTITSNMSSICNCVNCRRGRETSFPRTQIIDTSGSLPEQGSRIGTLIRSSQENPYASLDSLFSNTLLNTLITFATIPTTMENVVVRPTEEQINTATTIIAAPTNDTTCTICQDTIATNSSMRKLNKCSHEFHKTCIDMWFEQSVFCPMCRADIRE